VTADPDRRIEVFERELWRIAVEHLDYGEQIQWAALAGARVAPNGWRRAKAMLHFDRNGELKRTFLTTAVKRNRNPQLRIRALQEIAASRDAEAFDEAVDEIGRWSREERREGVKVMLQALAEKRIGRRDQANAWIWRMAEDTREVHEEYAVQRWPETKRLLGLLVNSSGGAHARNARRLVHASRKHDRRLAAALLAAALAHTPEAEEVLRGARTRMARKPSALARELLRNFPKGKRGRSRRRRKKGAAEGGEQIAAVAAGNGAAVDEAALDDADILDEEAADAAGLDDEEQEGGAAAPPDDDDGRPAAGEEERRPDGDSGDDAPAPAPHDADVVAEVRAAAGEVAATRRRGRGSRGGGGSRGGRRGSSAKRANGPSAPGEGANGSPPAPASPAPEDDDVDVSELMGADVVADSMEGYSVDE